MTNTRRIYSLVIGFGLVILLIVGLLTEALTHIQQSRHILDNTVAEHTACIDLAGQLYRISRERMDLLQRILDETDPFVQDEMISRFWALANEFVQVRTALIDNELGEAEMAVIHEQGERARYIVPLQEEVIDLLLAGDIDQARDLTIHKITPAHSQLLAMLVAFNDLQTTELRAAIEETRRIGRQAYILLSITGIIALVLTLIIAMVTYRRIADLTGSLVSAAESLTASLRELEFQKLAIDEHAIVSVTDAKGVIQYVNQRFCLVSQYANEELVGHTHRVVNSGQHAKDFIADLWTTIQSSQVWRGEICNRRKNGDLYWMDTTIVPFLDEHNKPYKYVGVQTEITSAKQAEAVLARSKEELERLVSERTSDLQARQAVLRTITGVAQDAIVMIDDTDVITFWNEAAVAIFGYSADEVMGLHLHDLLMPARYRNEFTAGFSTFVASGEGNFVGQRRELMALHKDGSEFPLELSLSTVCMKGRWTAIGLARDITERKRTEAVLRKLATSDPLTGIANRRQLDTALDLEIKRAERYHFPLSLVLFDIDHFKQINDSHGHQAGDRALIDLATLIAGNIRANDLFARWGGEEFVILANNCESAVATQMAEKLRSLIEEFSFHAVGKVTCSFGVAAFHAGESASDFVSRVDKALYMAKVGGRNRVVTS